MLGIRHYHGTAIDLWQGDITGFQCDGMANAANQNLAGGGGVDGAIHRVGGPVIMDACKQLGGCPVGSAVATVAGDLPATTVIHAVGPVWSGGNAGEPELLLSAYKSVWALAEEHSLRHVATPSLSTGAYKYPVELAASIAMQSIKEYFTTPKRSPQRITFVLFNREHYQSFQTALFQMFPELSS